MKSYLVQLDWFYRESYVLSLWLLTSLGTLFIVVADFSLGSMLVSLVTLPLDVKGSWSSALLVTPPLVAKDSQLSAQALFVGDPTSG